MRFYLCYLKKEKIPCISNVLLKPFLDFSSMTQTPTARLLTNLKRQDHITPLLVFTTALHLADAEKKKVMKQIKSQNNIYLK